MAAALWLAAGGSVRAISADESQPKLLDVPYVDQTEALCGGAAVSMVLRYWGAQGVRAEDFAALVDEEREGIDTDKLAGEVRRRGWRVFPFAGTRDEVRRHLSKGRPVVVLIEDRPNRFHYVVIAAWIGDRVVFHDPARAPFQTMQEARFEEVWTSAKRWSLVILPAHDHTGGAEVEPSDASSVERTPVTCAPLVAEGVERARRGDPSAAERLLEASRELCPSSSAPLRELAGLRLLQERWQEAAELAERAVAIDSGDAHAWRALATSRFLMRDLEDALFAFNRVGEPRVDLLRVDGLESIRYDVVAELIDLPAESMLTEDALRRAQRRLSDLPAVTSSRLGYTPQEGGRARVDVALVERSSFFGSPLDLVGTALRGVSEREVTLHAVSPTGGGELWSGSWRWWERRPRLSLAVDVPRLGGLRGPWRVEGLWERETFTLDESLVGERRNRAALSRRDWMSGDLLWEVSTGLEDWSERGKYFALSSALEKRLAADRIALRAEVARWSSAGDDGSFATGRIGAAWRTSDRLVRWRALARGGWSVASQGAPRMLWPGAGTGHARDVLLRAHPLLEDGIVRGEAFGHTLAHGSVELQRWLRPPGPVRIAVTTFVDLARIERRSQVDDRAGRAHADAGIGLRFGLAGDNGSFRVDIARGLVDGSVALSVGWQRAWPGWR